MTQTNSRISAPTVRVPSAAPTAAPRASGAEVQAPTVVDTADAASFSSGAGELAELTALIRQLDSRLSQMESRLSRIESIEGFDAPAAPAAPQRPAATGKGIGAPDAAVALPPGVNLPAYPGSVSAAGPTVSARPIPKASAKLVSQAEAMQAQIREAQDGIAMRQGDLQKLVDQGEELLPEEIAESGQLDAQSGVLRNLASLVSPAALKKYGAAEVAGATPAFERAQEILDGISKGEPLNPYVEADLFSIRQILADPVGAESNPALQPAADVLAQTASQRDQTADRLAALERVGAQAPLKPELRVAQGWLAANQKANADIAQAIAGAKLSGLDRAGQEQAAKAIARLGAIAGQLDDAEASPKRFEKEIFTLSQALKAPSAKPAAPAKPADAPKGATPAASGTEPKASAQVEQGGELLGTITKAQAGLRDQLHALDDKVLGGASSDSVRAEREALLERGEALETLATAVKAAKIDQSNPQARREVSAALEKASAIAKALAAGEDPAKFRPDVFVLKQTFADPLGAKDNVALQSASGALQLLGRAESANAKKRADIGSAIAKGTDARGFDAELAKLHRQSEDLEAVRRAIESANLAGLSDEQEATGAKLIDQLRDLAMKVANGEDFAASQATFAEAAKQLAALKGKAVASGPEKPATPAATDDKPAKPADKPAAPAKPADKPAAGGTYSVKAGDSLTKIAKEKLGNIQRYREIIELNKDKYPSLAKNPDLIHPGWTLVMPKS